jgi:DNA repair protein REV1
MASRGRRGKHQGNNDGFDKWGGYMQAKKTKLEEQFTESTKEHNLQEEQLKKGIFNGVAISVNGYTG